MGKVSIGQECIKHKEKLTKLYENLREKLDNIEPDTSFDDDKTEELNETMGDFADEILETIKNTNFPEELLKRDNKYLYPDSSAMSVFGNNIFTVKDKKKAGKVLEESIYNVYDEGTCLRIANLCNLVAHQLKDEETELGKKINVRATDIDDIRKDNSISGILDRATSKRDYEGFDFDSKVVEEELEKDKIDENNEDIIKIHNLMQSCGLGRKNKFDKKQTKAFFEALKVNELKQMMYSSKQLSFDAMLHNLSSKTKLYNEEKEKGDISKEELEPFRPKVAVIMCKEDKDKYKVKGKSLYRICGCFEGDVHPTQFHLTTQEVNNTTKRLEFPIVEYDKLLEELPLSCTIPKNEAEDLKKRGYLYTNSSALDRETASFKSFNPFPKIKLIIEKVQALSKINKKQLGLPEKGYMEQGGIEK